MSNQFTDDLRRLINQHGIDNDCRTADFILADHIMAALSSFELSCRRRDEQTTETPEFKLTKAIDLLHNYIRCAPIQHRISGINSERFTYVIKKLLE